MVEDESLKYDIQEKENEVIFRFWVDYPVKIGFKFECSKDYGLIIGDLPKIVVLINKIKERQKHLLENINCRHCDNLVSDKTGDFCLDKGRLIDGENFYEMAINCEYFEKYREGLE